MMKKLLSFAMVLTLVGCSTSTQPSATASEKNHALSDSWNAYVEKVDVDYAYDLAVKMEEIRSNEELGYRTAGSQAEAQTGDMLKAEMEKIGLTNVTKDEFTLDGWEFDHANMGYVNASGEQVDLTLGGYQTTFNTEGVKEYTVVNAGSGTEDDLADLDVNGKLVLVEINQRENWWINYPAYEAKINGAAAVIAYQNGGYSEVSDDALNAQDICGAADAPALSISKNDAMALIDTMEENNTNEWNVTLDVESTVNYDVNSYNIVGMIEGQSDEMVLMSAHYDSYFAGFQDDNAAIALMFGIAKGLVDSGYKPNKTLVFCAMAAEEWGVSNTRYDWSTGAYNEIFRVHPEWVGKVIADINFELPAHSEGDTDQIRSAYELVTFLEDFTPNVPLQEGVFENGIEVIAPTQTWSDDFSLSIAGIPSTVTALRGGFAETHYHTQYDNRDTYSKEAFKFHHDLYGMLMIAYDNVAVSPLNFTTRLEALKSVSTEAPLSDEQINTLTTLLDETMVESKRVYELVEKANAQYLEDQTTNEELNTKMLETFKYCEDNFVRLTWEDVSIFPHEHATNNILALQGAIEALENGEASTALDEYLYLVDNNWYAYDFSKDTFNNFTDYVLNQPSDRLMWGAGRVIGHVDLYDVINSLQEKGDGADYTEELAALNQALAQQEELLNTLVEEEVSDLTQLKETLQSIQ